MILLISNPALSWFKDEIDLRRGDYLRFHVRYGGASPVQDGFSLGMSVEEPISIGASTEKDEILFFIEEADLWYFNGHDLHVGYNEQLNDIEYNYINPKADSPYN